MKSYGLRKLVAVLLAVWAACLLASPAAAASCNYATSQGTTGPGDWQTYCWLDLTSYNDTTAHTAGGQNFSYTLPDGTIMTFNLKVTGTAAVAATAPSWTGAAVGNTAFLGISGKPILYQTGAGTTTATISSIVLTPPVSGTITNYMFVGADGKSSNENETLRFQTNGGNWQLLDQVGPISGATYPGNSGVGSNSFLETGAAGTVGAYIVGSTTPTTVTTTLVGGGLQGAMFAVRFASIRLTTQIVGTRLVAADQFAFTIKSTSGGSTLASGASSGTGLGPFTAAALSSSAAIPLTLAQAMAAGSTSTISHYHSALTCTNATSSSTPLPNNVVTTSYDFGSLQFGDAVQCTFTEAPYPHLMLTKALGASGRRFSNDQFIMNITQGSTVEVTTTTTGTGSTVTNGVTSQYQGSAGTSYTFDELGSGVTALDQYTSTMSCSNLWTTSSTSLPSSPGGSVTPQLGDVISCTITNTRRTTNGTLSITKVSIPLSDPVNGTTNPMVIPGAIIRYTIYVQNSGSTAIASNSIFILDAVPSKILVGNSSAPAFANGTPTSGLTLPGTGIKYSNSATTPASFAACNYTPTSAYDPSVHFICLSPTGSMNGRTTTPAGSPPNFSISFQAQVR